jgi:restriction endonuclease S subunit
MKQKRHKLSDVMAEMSGGATPKVTEDYYLDEGGVPFLRVQNITEMGINLEDVKYIKPEVHETMLKRSQLKKDDLVFTITGRIGSVAVVPEKFEGNINQHSVRFHLRDKVNDTKVLPEFVAAFFNTTAGRNLSFRSTTGGTRPALDYEALKNLIFPLPSETKQEKIVGSVRSYYEKVKYLQIQAAEILSSAQKQVEQMILA